MPKLRGPLFSLEARGTLGDCLTYQEISGVPIVKANRFPTYSRTDAQDDVRDTFSWASLTWLNLHAPKKTTWQNYTNYRGLSGYKAFMDQFLRRTYLVIFQFELPPDIGFCVVGNHYVGEFTVGGAFLPPVLN